ncbi:Kv channel-interacting protein 4-like isoform X1 [Anopheles albimanus]|nr:Kv channel-interacting protein 4-like isoform X1 [Anopheles albimanus]XP_035782478.1 Kv channel-interacting protein 4-like isoform X1 [Anopheles albimanus]XP_035782479.1 Kv channel-interacting protein 4-like isoform X1 [Anopheles albimanus]XP_035782480.1 Kv channel-interacting protein 4-like isoform X1 [Anopheles albimanus]XP_035782481.1 Kv channel-interacting protein 4-like isoform X1 [Anopheles albimanus]
MQLVNRGHRSNSTASADQQSLAHLPATVTDIALMRWSSNGFTAIPVEPDDGGSTNSSSSSSASSTGTFEVTLAASGRHGAGAGGGTASGTDYLTLGTSSQAQCGRRRSTPQSQHQQQQQQQQYQQPQYQQWHHLNYQRSRQRNAKAAAAAASAAAAAAATAANSPSQPSSSSCLRDCLLCRCCRSGAQMDDQKDADDQEEGNYEYCELEEIVSPPKYRPESIAALCEATRFTEAEIKRIYRGFKAECPAGIIREETFKFIYSQFFPQGANTGLYAHYVFNTLDKENTGILSFENFVQGLSILSRGTLEEKLCWTFSLYDINHDGKITREEMTDIVTAIYELMGARDDGGTDEVNIKSKVDTIFQKMDTNRDGVITIEEFLDCCRKDQLISSSMGVFDSTI